MRACHGCSPTTGLGPFPGHTAYPTPKDLCENARDAHGVPGAAALGAGDIPRIQPAGHCGSKLSCRVNEGQIVLTNGVVAPSLDVRSGEGLRLRLINAAVSRYFRLWLTDPQGRRIALHRVGGEGGLLDRVRLEGGRQGTLDLKYDRGEILLASADRAEVVIVVPEAKEGEVLTLWTGDYQRYGTTEYPYGYGVLPSVPVATLRITDRSREMFRIAEDDPLRLHPAVDATDGNLRTLPVTAQLRDPAKFAIPLPGTADEGLGPRLRALIIVVVAVSVLLVVSDLVTSSLALCGSCHEMTLRAEQWEQSAHASVKCVSCHVAPHEWYELPKSVVLQSALVLRDTGVHLSGEYEDPVDSRPADATPMTDETCLQCHDPNRQATSGYRILIDHPKHAEENGSCISCHVRTGHPIEARGRAITFMAQCFTCHGTAPDAKAPADCELCHPSDYELTAHAAKQDAAKEPEANDRGDDRAYAQP